LNLLLKHIDEFLSSLDQVAILNISSLNTSMLNTSLLNAQAAAQAVL
jgi:hypothetical protein